MDVAVQEDDMSQAERMKLSLGTWALLFGALVTMGTVASGIAFKVFASKEEVHEMQLDETRREGVAKLQEWRIKTVETKVDNMAAQQTRIDRNVDKLLERFRVTAEPPPQIKSLPAPPSPDELLPDPGE